MRSTHLALAFLLLLRCYGSVHAQPFTCEGMLKTAGVPASGNYDLQFSLWTAASGGAQTGSALTLTGVPLQNGGFIQQLDFGAISDGGNRYLQVAVRPAGSGDFVPLSPRIRLSDLVPSSDAPWRFGADALYLSGKGYSLTVRFVEAPVFSTPEPPPADVAQWQVSSTSAPAGGGPVLGPLGNGLTLPYAGSVNYVGAAFSITNTATSGTSYAGYFRSDSTSGFGVFGLASSGTGYSYGVYGRSMSTAGRGVVGHVASPTGNTIGVMGIGDSTSGTGVYGYATATSGNTTGVYGRSASSSGRGVYGLASATSGTNYGGYFQTNSPDGYAGYFVGRGYFSGNVGIGVLNPAVKLDVDGSIRVTGFQMPAGAAAGLVLTSDASGVGTWQSLPPPSGPAGGDLSGSYPNPTVARIQGRAVASTAPSSGQVLKWDGSAWVPAGDGLTLPFSGSANVGSGAVLQVANTATSGGAVGLWGESASTSGTGVYGAVTAASGGTCGVYGQSASTEGRGVFGWATATSGTTYGGYFKSASTEGRGVFGLATATSGSTYGGWFQSASTSGTGVRGDAIATSGYAYGVYGQSASTEGRGVFGWATATSGTTYGGYFENASTGGRGVFGWATATSGETYGVFGKSDSTSGTGVFGYARATSGTNYGVLGETVSSSGYGVYSRGRFAATGTKSFQIDHPLDPENAYLSHFCTEGPEPMNAYSGNVVTDAQGYATVQLPPYFESINRDYRYQLTVIDSSDDFVLAKVVREIQNNRFVIRTSKPFVKVSWRVEAVRNDRWVQEYGYQAEQPKPREHRGRYLHPELYGQPKELGIHYHPEPEQEQPVKQ